MSDEGCVGAIVACRCLVLYPVGRDPAINGWMDGLNVDLPGFLDEFVIPVDVLLLG